MCLDVKGIIIRTMYFSTIFVGHRHWWGGSIIWVFVTAWIRRQSYCDLKLTVIFYVLCRRKLYERLDSLLDFRFLQQYFDFINGNNNNFELSIGFYIYIYKTHRVREWSSEYNKAPWNRISTGRFVCRNRSLNVIIDLIRHARCEINHSKLYTCIIAHHRVNGNVYVYVVKGVCWYNCVLERSEVSKTNSRTETELHNTHILTYVFHGENMDIYIMLSVAHIIQLCY